MNLGINKSNIEKQKKMYLVFISIIVITIILGFFFYFIVSDSNKKLVIDLQKEFFSNIGNINYLSSFINSFISNFLYLFIIFILGLSVVGFVFIIGIIIFKSFILGFSVSSIIGSFGIKGILLSFLYIFPHQIIYLIILLLMSFFGIRFCYRLFKYIFLKSSINFRMLKDKYIKVFLFCILGSFLCSLYEVFIMTYLLKVLV